MHRLLLGQPIPLAAEIFETIPFFSEVTYSELPACPFALGYRQPCYRGEPFIYIGGPAHLQKNLVEQLRSSIRTICFGSKHCDASAALQLGLWPGSYIGTDSMSDQQAALWFLVKFQFPGTVFPCI